MEGLLVQVHAEGSTATIATMKGTGTTPLRATAAKPSSEAQVVQDTRHRQLGFDMSEVYEHLLASRWNVR